MTEKNERRTTTFTFNVYLKELADRYIKTLRPRTDFSKYIESLLEKDGIEHGWLTADYFNTAPKDEPAPDELPASASEEQQS
jgi:hypothetical protein